MVGWDGHAFMRYSYIKRRKELNSDGVGSCPETSPGRLTCTFDFCYYLLWAFPQRGFLEHGPRLFSSCYKPYPTIFPPLSSTIVLSLQLSSLLFGPREPGMCSSLRGQRAAETGG